MRNLEQIKKLHKEIIDKKFAPVYFFHGDEAYYIDQFTELIENTAIEEFERDFNQTIVYGSDVDMSQIIGMAKEFPMMAERKTVIIKEAQLISDFTRNSDLLVKYLENPQNSTVLVFAYKYKKIDNRKSVFKKLAKVGHVFESSKLYPNELAQWVDKRFKDAEIGINPHATAMLIEFVGDDLSTLNNQFVKLKSILKPGEIVTPELVEQYVGISKDYNNFEFISAIARRDVLKANKIINKFAENQKENPIQLTISSLFSYFSKLLTIHSMGTPNRAQVMSALRIHNFFVDEYMQAAKNYDLRKSVRVISDLRQADMRSKGVGASQVNNGDILKELTYKILH